MASANTSTVTFTNGKEHNHDSQGHARIFPGCWTGDGRRFACPCRRRGELGRQRGVGVLGGAISQRISNLGTRWRVGELIRLSWRTLLWRALLGKDLLGLPWRPLLLLWRQLWRGCGCRRGGGCRS